MFGWAERNACYEFLGMIHDFRSFTISLDDIFFGTRDTDDIGSNLCSHLHST